MASEVVPAGTGSGQRRYTIHMKTIADDCPPPPPGAHARARTFATGASC